MFFRMINILFYSYLSFPPSLDLMGSNWHWDKFQDCHFIIANLAKVVLLTYFSFVSLNVLQIPHGSPLKSILLYLGQCFIYLFRFPHPAVSIPVFIVLLYKTKEKKNWTLLYIFSLRLENCLLIKSSNLPRIPIYDGCEINLIGQS